jgi:hypothetical protein
MNQELKKRLNIYQNDPEKIMILARQQGPFTHRPSHQGSHVAKVRLNQLLNRDSNFKKSDDRLQTVIKKDSL